LDATKFNGAEEMSPSSTALMNVTKFNGADEKSCEPWNALVALFTCAQVGVGRGGRSEESEMAVGRQLIPDVEAVSERTFEYSISYSNPYSINFYVLYSPAADTGRRGRERANALYLIFY
jgi:hypothetical protein